MRNLKISSPKNLSENNFDHEDYFRNFAESFISIFWLNSRIKILNLMVYNFSSDQPIQHKEDDKFQRYNFSKKIADTIIQSPNEDGIVIGINGEWGEGKTSVMNFIEKELRLDNSISVIKFNPWRYSDEEALIKNLLKKIAEELGKQLESTRQRLGELAKKYGSIGDVFGFDITKIGETLSTVDLENLKNRVDEFLVLNKRKIVVLVDDIDRLDKHEIYSVFKLVKLTADFKYTTYILSFDENMVANAIGERFGEINNTTAGKDFLEKIIQVPLRIPQIQPAALKLFCFELVEQSVNQNSIEIEKDDIQTFIYQFTQNLLLKLNTPRLAVRYANSLAFAFSLLKGEVNYIDLMLIEAIKIMYPKHYEFIKHNDDYFLSSYESFSPYGRVLNNVEERKKELKQHLENLSLTYKPSEKVAILKLLTHLFPRLDEALNNHYRHEGYKRWYKEKRIGSASYFTRYFLYDVLQGEVSDTVFTNLLELLKTESKEIIKSEILQIMEISTPDTVIFKLRYFEEDLPEPSAKKLILALAELSDSLPNNDSVFSFGIDGPLNQAAILIYTILKNKKYNDAFLTAQVLMEKPIDLEFSFKILKWLRFDKENLFDEIQLLALSKILRKRLLEKSGDTPIFISYPNHAHYIISTWKSADPLTLEVYYFNIFSNNPKYIADLIFAFTSTIYSSAVPEPYKKDFEKDDYEALSQTIDKTYVYTNLREHFSEEMDKEIVQFYHNENSQTSINILRQFEHWYVNDFHEAEIVE